MGNNIKWYIRKKMQVFLGWLFETIEIMKFVFILGIILLPFCLITESMKVSGLGVPILFSAFGVYLLLKFLSSRR